MELEMITREPGSNPKITPLLFVHGAWHGAWCWDEHFLPYFADKGYTVHALSLRGHGKSGGRYKWARIKHYVDDVAQAAATLPTPPIVIGHSMGGHIVQKYLEKYAAPAAVLVASNPVHGATFATFRTVKSNPLGFLKANLVLDLRPIISDPKHARHTLFRDDFPADVFASYHPQIQGESYIAYLGMMLLELPRPKKINTPMLVIGAEKDAIFSPDEERRTARAYHADVEIFPNMGHDMMLETNWQAVADRILGWLDSRGF